MKLSCCIVPFLLILLVPAGCGISEGKKAATQVAARVNSNEITVHQINSVLGRTQDITPEAAKQAQRDILERLIERQLARQQAVERRIDRRPDIMQSIENAKDEILARAYVEQIAATQPKPTVEEAKKYYADHPELFTQRRIFNLEEIVVISQDGLARSLAEQVARSRSMHEVAAWLRSKGVMYSEGRFTRASEQIPLEVLPRLHAMKDGEMLFADAGSRLYVIRPMASQIAPVDEDAAMPRIQQALFNQRAREVVALEIRRIRDRAKIEYVGEFAALDATDAAITQHNEKAEKAVPGKSRESGIERGARELR